ncbi:hypothetical protein Tco_0404407, partial [Tanacetum coccineum]
NTNEATIVKPKSVNETIVSKSKINRDEVIIEDWTSDDEDDVCADNTVSSNKPNVTQAVRSQADKSGQTSQKQRIDYKKVHKIKACYVCKSTGHLIKDYDFFDQKSPEPRVKNVVNTGKRVVKPVWDYGKRGNPEILLQDHVVVDSGCSSHMTGNKAYLSEYEDFNGGFVAFGSDPKGGKITGKGTQDSYVAGSSGKDKGPTQEYILLPLQPRKTRIPAKDVVQDAQEQPSENASLDKGIQVLEDVFDKEGQHQMPEDEQVWQDELEMMVTQELVANAMHDESRQAFKEEKRRIASQNKATQATSANADESSFVYLGGKIPIDASTLPNADLPINPNMLDLEDASDTLPNDGIFNGAYDDDEDVGAVADFNNMDNTIAVSPIPTLRIHKDHPKGQILGDPTLAVQTRGKIQKASSAQQALLDIFKEFDFLSSEQLLSFWSMIGSLIYLTAIKARTSCLLFGLLLDLQSHSKKPTIKCSEKDFLVIMEEPALTENQQQVDVNFLEED